MKTQKFRSQIYAISNPILSSQIDEPNKHKTNEYRIISLNPLWMQERSILSYSLHLRVDGPHYFWGHLILGVATGFAAGFGKTKACPKTQT